MSVDVYVRAEVTMSSVAVSSIGSVCLCEGPWLDTAGGGEVRRKASVVRFVPIAGKRNPRMRSGEGNDRHSTSLEFRQGPLRKKSGAPRGRLRYRGLPAVNAQTPFPALGTQLR